MCLYISKTFHKIVKPRVAKRDLSTARIYNDENRQLRECLLDLVGQIEQGHECHGIKKSATLQESLDNAKKALSIGSVVSAVIGGCGMSDTLLPCPFCGADPNDEGCWPVFRDKSAWMVSCPNPECEADVEGQTKETTINAWNRRAGGDA